MLSKEDRKAYEIVDTKFEKSYNLLFPLFKKFNELENLYWFYTPRSQKSYKSNVFDPMAFEQVEHTVSHLFANDPKGSYVPIEKGDDINTDIANEILKYQWNKPGANMRKKFVNTGKNFAIFGIAFAELGWRYERPYSKLQNKFVTTWDDPCLRDLNVYDCYPDVDARDPSDMSYFIYDEYLTPEELYNQNSISQGVKRYKNIDKLKELIKDDKNINASEQNPYRDNAKRKRDLKVLRGGYDNGRLLIRRYKSHDRWITILPDYKLVIEDRANPYDHGGLGIHVLVDHDYPGLLYGIGELDPIKSIMTMQNQTLNMRLDNVKNILQPPFQAKYSALRHKHSWKFGQNALWIVDTIGDVQQFAIPDVTGGTFNQTTNWVQDTAARRMGRTDFLSRNDTDENRTATEVKAMVGEQNARLRYKEKNIDEFVKGIAVEWMQLNQQFLKKERALRITGSEAIMPIEERFGQIDPETGEAKFEKVDGKDYGFLKVSPDDIRGAFDFQVESGSTRSVDINNEIQNLNAGIKLATELTSALQQEGITVQYKPLIEDVFRRLGIKNTDKIFQTTQTIMEDQSATLPELEQPQYEQPTIPGFQ